MNWIAISALEVALAAACIYLVVLFMRGRRAERNFTALGEVAEVSDSAGSLEEALEAVCDVIVPALADFCMIDVIEDESVRRVAVRVAPSAPPNAEQGLRERKPSIPERMVHGEGPPTPEPRFFERMSEADLREIAHDDGDLEFVSGLGVRSAITVALQARGKVTGALTFGVAWSGRRYKPRDAHFAWVLSGRIALALDNRGLFHDLEKAEGARAEIAETLQRGLLPSPLPHIPGWSLAAMYRPAGAENEVGGDFYDAFRVAGGWMLVIGDVTGRGAQAASITALARYTLRTAAELTNDPLVALAALNRALLARSGAALCSIAALSLGEDSSQPVQIAVAGHPPPLLVDGDEVSEAAPADPVLGAFADSEWRIGRSHLMPGQQLVLVTDGIIEATGDEGRFGEERLRTHLEGASNPAHAVRQLEGALHSFAAGMPDDDAAILAISRAGEGSPSPAVARVDLAGDAGGEGLEALVGRLFHAFNQRDADGIVALCSEEMEFLALTGEEVGRENPYWGRDGLREYLADVEQVLGRAADHPGPGAALRRPPARHGSCLRTQPGPGDPGHAGGLGLDAAGRPLRPRRGVRRSRAGAGPLRTHSGVSEDQPGFVAALLGYRNGQRLGDYARRRGEQDLQREQR